MIAFLTRPSAPPAQALPRLRGAPADLRPRVVDGSPAGGWVVLDYFDVLVHVMRTDVRERYDLESLWGDAPTMKPKKAKAKKTVK